MQVAELVPKIAALDRSPVRTLEKLSPRSGLEQLQVRRLALVPTGEQPVDRAERPLRGHNEARPAAAFTYGAARLGDGLERPHDGRADGDHAPVPAVNGVDERRRRRGDVEALGEGRLPMLGRGDAG